MKAHAENHAPHRGRVYKGGAQAFIHKGTNDRWRAILSAEDCRRYEATAEQRLSRICARWLAAGGSIDPALVGSTAGSSR